MKLAILCRRPNLYSHKRLAEAAKERGHDIRFINPLSCYMNIMSTNPEVHTKNGEAIKDIDAIIPRIGASVTFYGTAVLRQFEMMGVYTVNSSIAIARSRDKLRSLQLLTKKGIDMPITGFANSPKNTKDLIQLVGGAPLVIKLIEGTQGKGVFLAETNKTAEGIINAFKDLKANILVQEFIREAQGSDIRCFVVGDKVVAAMMRRAQEGEFRANIHQGGTAELIELTEEEERIAIKSAEVMGLNVAGVDILRSENGPKILEINSSPGLEGIESITKIDIADLIIDYIEQHYVNGPTAKG